jgi:hypothetical protein
MLCVAVTALAHTPVAAAAGADLGRPGPSHVDAPGGVTGEKPESALWWNDGYWWASMYSASADAPRIFRLDETAEKWTDTGFALDRRPGSRADALWDGDHLYLASHLFDREGSVGEPSELRRYSYDPDQKSYALDEGFPVEINQNGSESLVIDKDSTGRLWAAWTRGGLVYVNHTTTDDTSWATPFALPGQGRNVTADDIASLIAFGHSRIGVIWSNQADGSFRFAVHVDSRSPKSWEPIEIPLHGPGVADDHVNLKADSDGRVLAAVKTSLKASDDPLIMVLVREPDGRWSSRTVSTKSESHTRPRLLLDEQHDTAYLLATGPQPPSEDGQHGGDIVLKTAPLSTLSFGKTKWTTVLHEDGSPYLNDVTSTKQTVNGDTGLVAVASNEALNRYWWFSHALRSTREPPVARFVMETDLVTTSPRMVEFRDLSLNVPTGWSWDFGDGSPLSTERDPVHVYERPGRYAVTLEVRNGAGSDRVVRQDYVMVSSPPALQTGGGGGGPGRGLQVVAGAAPLAAGGLVGGGMVLGVHRAVQRRRRRRARGRGLRLRRVSDTNGSGPRA